MEKFKLVVEWLKGKKTYILGAAAVVFGLLVYLGVITSEEAKAFAEEMGTAIVLFGLIVMSLRGAIAELFKKF
jgi:hypothetical protein